MYQIPMVPSTYNNMVRHDVLPMNERVTLSWDALDLTMKVPYMVELEHVCLSVKGNGLDFCLYAKR